MKQQQAYAHLTRAAEHFVAQSKDRLAQKELNANVAEHHTKRAAMYKTQGDDEASRVHEDLADAHRSMSERDGAMVEECKSMAAHCIEHAKLLQSANKAVSLGSDLDELEPSPISRIVPDVPGNVRAIPRVGGPPIQKAASDWPPEFQRAFSTDPED